METPDHSTNHNWLVTGMVTQPEMSNFESAMILQE
jgi:hypothetical protein